MKAWMMALIGKGRQLKIFGPYTANTTVVIPATAARLETLIAKGGSGSPQTLGVLTAMYRTVSVVYDSPIYGENSQQSTFVNYSEGTNYCDPPIYYPDEHATVTYCYEFKQEVGVIPATTGAPTIAFGRSFAGGVGGPAAPATYNNEPVNPGGSYNLQIPPGGSVTYTLYQ